MRIESGGWWARVGGILGGKEKQRAGEVKRALLQTQDPRPETRRSAAWRLGKLGDASDEVREALTKLKTDPDRLVQKAADWALRSLGN